MKKIVRYIIGIVFSMLLFTVSGCIDLRTEEEIVDEMVTELITSLDSKDKDKIKLLLANGKINDINNFDQSIDELLNYYDGTYVSKADGGKGKDRDKHHDYQASWYNLSYDVTTTCAVYRIAVYWCTEYTTDSDMIGIWSFYIIKMSEDSTPEYSYRGDGLWTPGINIGEVYTKDENE